MTKSEVIRKAVVNVARVVVAATFIFAGFVKLDDPMGTVYKVSEYIAAFDLGSLLPHRVILTAFVVLFATFELYLGLAILLAISRRLNTFLLLITMVVFTLVTFFIAYNDSVPHCGCFGDVLVLTNWQTFYKNILLLIIAFILWLFNSDIRRMISKRSQWMIRLYTITYCILFACYSLYFLPPFDFLRYKVGTDISNSTDANFFAIELNSGADMTADLLTGYSLILTSDDIAKASDSEMERINILAAFANRYGMKMAMMTATEDNAEIERWRDLTGAEYPILWSDVDELRSIVRSNPGLMLLKDGVVVNKWSHSNIPSDINFEQAPSKQSWIKSEMSTRKRTALKIVLWFTIPLLLWVLVDRMYVMWIKHKCPGLKLRSKHKGTI